MKNPRFFLLWLWLIALGLWTITPVRAESDGTVELGVRGGVSDDRNEEDYSAGEAYCLKGLPWGGMLSDSARLSTRFDVGLGYLEAAGDRGGYWAMGGDLVLAVLSGRLELEIGLRPTWLFDHEFGDDNFGGAIQFTSHAGVALHFHPVVLSYRLQHTSNAGIYAHNSGLNLHLVGLGYRF